MIDVSNDAYLARMAIVEACAFMQAPSVLYRPTLSADGTKWCALLGENLQEGVAGFGDTPAEAMADFDKAFNNSRTPAAIRAAIGMVGPEP